MVNSPEDKKKQRWKPPKKQGRILLVDDVGDPHFPLLPRRRRLSVATASSAPQAEALLQRQVFDLYFLDLRLGEDNGLTFSRPDASRRHGCAW